MVYDLKQKKKKKKHMFILKRLSKRLEITDLFKTLTFAPAKISFLTTREKQTLVKDLQYCITFDRHRECFFN